MFISSHILVKRAGARTVRAALINMVSEYIAVDKNMKLIDLKREDLLYPLRNDEIHKKLYKLLRKICMEKNIGCNPIIIDNAIKKLLSRARKFIPELELELLAKSWIAAASNTELLQCFSNSKLTNNCEKVIENAIEGIVQSLKQMQTATRTAAATTNILQQPAIANIMKNDEVIKKFIEKLENIFYIATMRYGKEFLSNVAKELCTTLSEVNEDMGSLCDLALKKTDARVSEYEIITKFRQKISGKNIAKLIREDREAR
ncbi:MAG: hypothetical protein LM582_07715 [Desulfurococcaceae archaeon]|nr:hypothetical protein [Desulfurococcaceae archaeon]